MKKSVKGVGKKVLASALSAAMVVAFAPAVAVAGTEQLQTTSEGSATPQPVERQAGSFEDLVVTIASSGSGDTVKLTADIEIPAGQYVTIDENITLDGNGKKVTIKADGNDYGTEGLWVTSIAGATISGVTFENLAELDRQEAAVYITGTGTDQSRIVIQGCTFNGGADLKDAGGMGVSTTYGNTAYVDVKGCEFNNLKYAMYFNALKNASITNNTIDGTLYNAINIAGDNGETYASSDIEITGNTLTNISSANYDDPEYSSGIRIGKETSNVTVSGNTISMLNGKQPIYYDNVAEGTVATVNGTMYSDLGAAIEAASSSGQTVTLLNNATIAAGAYITINKNITLDGNGKTITIASDSNDYGVEGLWITSDSGAIVKDVVFAGLDKLGSQEAAVYITGAGTSDSHIVIEGCTFNGGTTLEGAGGMGVSTTYGSTSYVDVKDCAFTNLKYAMYFNALKNASITNNTIDGTLYNAINIAGDNGETYASSDIEITGNTLTNISSANYDDPEYSSGIRVGKATSKITITGNDISMLNGKLPVYYDNTAMIGETTYGSLAGAIEAAADGETVTLLSDASIAAGTYLDITKNITLDGGGHHIYIEANGSAYGIEGIQISSQTGATINNVVFDNLADLDSQESAIYITGAGTSDRHIVIQGCTFNGGATLEGAGGMGISTPYGAIAYVDVKNCEFNNLKYAMYFNSISHAAITGNKIDGTLYNAINIAGDNGAEYASSNVAITGNTLTNISSANYDDPKYSSGIRIGKETSNVTVSGNTITMLNGKQDIYYDNPPAEPSTPPSSGGGSTGGGTVTPPVTPTPTPEPEPVAPGTAVDNATAEDGSTVEVIVNDNTPATVPGTGETALGTVTFAGTEGQTSVTVPATVQINGGTYVVTGIAEGAFKGESTLTSVSIPATVTSIGTSAFEGCGSLTSVTIPATVTSIGESAFAGTAITSASIPAGVTTIEASTFAGCESLATVEVAGDVTVIADSAFAGCTNLTSVEIPATVTTIGTSAFAGCENLTSVTIPDGAAVGESAFAGSGLTSVSIGKNVTVGKSAFQACDNLKKVTVKSKTLGAYAFKKCTGLKSVTIGSSVTKIERSAFSGCKSLKSVTIPKSVTSIGKNALYGAKNVKTLTVNSKSLTKSSVKDALNGSKVTTVKVPKSMLSAYKKVFSQSNCGKKVTLKAIK